MTQLVGLLNGTNKNYDTQLTALAKALLSSSCVVRGVGGGLAVSATEVASGEAFISCTRTNGEKVMVHYKNTEAVSIVGTGTKKVFVKVDQAKLDDGSGNALDGSGIASIQTDTVYPSDNYVALASIASSTITDARIYDDTVLFTLETILKEKKGSDIASGTTTDLSTATGNLVHITGTTTITSFGTVQAGVSIKLVFDGALILTHHATNLILPGGANITTSTGDSGIFVSEGGGAWKCIGYTKADGTALFSNGGISQNSANIYGSSTTGNDTYVITPSPAFTSYTAGMVLNVKVDVTNTGPATLNVNGLGAKSLLRGDGSALSNGDIPVGISQWIYDGTQFLMLSQLATPKTTFCTSFSRTLSDADNTQTIAHGLVRAPKWVRVSGFVNAGGGSGWAGSFTGYWDGTNTAGSFTGNNNASDRTGGSSTKLITAIADNASGAKSEATVSTDTTNVSLAWLKTSGPTRTTYVVLECGI